MTGFTAQDPEFRERVRDSFGRQKVMAHLKAELRTVEPGVVEIALPYQEHLTQQHGFVHAGIVSTVLDSACGYAAFTLMPSNAGVLSIEFKINLLAPAKGDEFLARGRVARAGRTITVCEGDVLAGGKAVASMQATMMTILDRPGIEG